MKYECINKSELVSKVADITHESKRLVLKVLDGLIETTSTTISEGKGIKLMGLGTIEIVDVAEKKARNPKTGEQLIVPPHKTVKAKISENLKELVK